MNVRYDDVISSCNVRNTKYTHMLRGRCVMGPHTHPLLLPGGGVGISNVCFYFVINNARLWVID
jgi:hypothetical protein